MVGNHQRELTQIRDDHKVELNRMQKALDVVSEQFLAMKYRFESKWNNM